MPGVTMKVPSELRDRIRALADQSEKTMSRVVEEALECYERSLGEVRYLEGWARFQREDPKGFSEYLGEAEEVERGLTDVLPE